MNQKEIAACALECAAYFAKENNFTSVEEHFLANFLKAVIGACEKGVALSKESVMKIAFDMPQFQAGQMSAKVLDLINLYAEHYLEMLMTRQIWKNLKEVS